MKTLIIATCAVALTSSTGIKAENIHKNNYSSTFYGGPNRFYGLYTSFDVGYSNFVTKINKNMKITKQKINLPGTNVWVPVNNINNMPTTTVSETHDNEYIVFNAIAGINFNFLENKMYLMPFVESNIGINKDIDLVSNYGVGIRYGVKFNPNISLLVDYSYLISFADIDNYVKTNVKNTMVGMHKLSLGINFHPYRSNLVLSLKGHFGLGESLSSINYEYQEIVHSPTEPTQNNTVLTTMKYKQHSFGVKVGIGYLF